MCLKPADDVKHNTLPLEDVTKSLSKHCQFLLNSKVSEVLPEMRSVNRLLYEYHFVLSAMWSMIQRQSNSKCLQWLQSLHCTTDIIVQVSNFSDLSVKIDERNYSSFTLKMLMRQN